jgi:hypothetical protein
LQGWKPGTADAASGLLWEKGAPPPKLARSGDQSQRNLPREAALVEPLDNG